MGRPKGSRNRKSIVTTGMDTVTTSTTTMPMPVVTAPIPLQVPLVTVLTPTRNRPVPFALTERWMQRQTYRGPLQWLVVNDGAVEYDYHCEQEVLLRTPQPGEGHSLCANLLHAIPHVRGEYVAIVEDDDWFAPSYIANLVAHLKEFPLSGSAPAFYYNLPLRIYRTMHNHAHCSLSQTGFRREVLPFFESLLRRGDPIVDLLLWREWAGTRHIYPNLGLHVSMKGLPGEPGIGSGHGAWTGFEPDDAVMTELERWVGEDIQYYADIIDQCAHGQLRKQPDGTVMFEADQDYCLDRTRRFAVPLRSPAAQFTLVRAGHLLPVEDAIKYRLLRTEEHITEARHKEVAA